MYIQTSMYWRARAGITSANAKTMSPAVSRMLPRRDFWLNLTAMYPSRKSLKIAATPTANARFPSPINAKYTKSGERIASLVRDRKFGIVRIFRLMMRIIS